jgi:phage terminase small subunit
VDNSEGAALTPKQKAFVHEYGVDRNCTQAAIRAGYSQRTAYSAGQRLLKHVEVGKAIQRNQAKRLSKADVTAERVITELAFVGFSQTDPELPKPSEKVAALQTLARTLGLFVDKHEHVGSMAILSVNVTQQDLADATRLVEQFKHRPAIEGEVVNDAEEDETK